MIRYVCRYCGEELGQLDQNKVDEKRLGFQTLTHEEREDIITYMPNGEIITRVICDYCQEIVEKNPDLLLISNPLQ